MAVYRRRYQQKSSEVDYSKKYLTFEILTSGKWGWTKVNSANTRMIYWRKNGGEWTAKSSATTSDPNMRVVAGDIIEIKGSGSNTSFATSTSVYNNFVADSNISFNVSGNIMSLIHGDDFIGKTSLTADNTFICLFRNNTGIRSAENLVMPATTITASCYDRMFAGSSITKAPKILPALTVKSYCYEFMFSVCENLTTAPELPATTLASYCYYGMFVNTKITTAPVLPALTLVSYCYSNMFEDCSYLTYIKAMFTTAPGSSYTSSWVGGVAASGTFVKNSAATWTGTGVSFIPSGWTIQTASS